MNTFAEHTLDEIVGKQSNEISYGNWVKIYTIQLNTLDHESISI